MSETVKFTCGKNGPANHQFVLFIKSDFFKKFPDMNVEKLEKMNILEIFQDPYQTGTFLHRENGPAFYTVATNEDGKPKHKEFWINGNRVDKEQAKRMEHDIDFSETVGSIINADDAVSAK